MGAVPVFDFLLLMTIMSLSLLLIWQIRSSQYSLERYSTYVHFCCERLCTSSHSNRLRLPILELQYQLLPNHDLSPLVGIGPFYVGHTKHNYFCWDAHIWLLCQLKCRPQWINFHNRTVLLVASPVFSNPLNPRHYYTLQSREKKSLFFITVMND